MNRKSFLVGLLAAGCFVATSTLMMSPGNARADPKARRSAARSPRPRRRVAKAMAGYDPIKDASGKVIGIWYVGYEK